MISSNCSVISCLMSPPSNPIRVRVLISGRVQGVCFRMETRDEARRLGLSGWVRNLPDGRVEAEIEGPPDLVSQLVNWCHHGPPLARVNSVEKKSLPPLGESDPFTVRS